MTEKMERLTGHLKDIDEADKATCVIPKENKVPLCTFKEKGEANLSISINSDNGVNKFEAYKGNNADLADRYPDEDLVKKKELRKDNQYDGNCFTDNKRASEKSQCIVSTSGVFEATSRDNVTISIDKDLGEQ